MEILGEIAGFMMVLMLVVSAVEMFRVNSAIKKYTNAGIVITNNHVVKYMLTMLSIGIFPNKILRDIESTDTRVMVAKYVFMMIIEIIVLIYMLCMHNYVKKQYVFQDDYLYRIDNEMDRISYGMIQAMYSNTETPERKTIYINNKKYIAVMSEEFYDSIKGKLNGTVQKRNEIIDGGDVTLKRMVFVSRVGMIIMTIAIFVAAVIFLKEDVPQLYMNIVCGGIIFICVFLIIVVIYADRKKNKLVKKILNSELI